ncbi:MAG: hypothetical protein Q7T97_05110 [Burkholderiaceae bacterium]|nr:hypothetical protein [Burkholderiaceae bacterium]
MTMRLLLTRLSGCAVLIGLSIVPLAAAAWDMTGTRALTLHARNGDAVKLGTVQFTPQADGRTGFVVTIEPESVKDYFLSMKEFKCVDGSGEILCHVPYPYPQPGTVKANDYAWLEHSLMFMFKTPAEFGARLWNGIYFQLHLTEQGLEGRPQAIDLNQISAPPDKPHVPPYRAALRSDIPAPQRWFNRLTIE